MKDATMKEEYKQIWRIAFVGALNGASEGNTPDVIEDAMWQAWDAVQCAEIALDLADTKVCGNVGLFARIALGGEP